MCIGQDVRGNIKVSLKAMKTPPESEPKQGVNVWASVGNVSEIQANDDLDQNRKNKPQEERDEPGSVPSIIIRSAEECDSVDYSISQATEERKSRRKNSGSTSEEGLSKNTSAKRQKRSPEAGSTGGKSLKIGDRITAKICQVRALGLVLDLGGGFKGMYRFEVIYRESRMIFG